MSGTDYNYDEHGQFFPYFVLTITGLITVPLTYYSFKAPKELENTAPRIRSNYKLDDSDLIDEEKKKRKRRERKLKRMIFSALGWITMASMVYLIIVTARYVPKIWDPYEVLSVSRSASEKQIKSHYRKLSLLWHPDKVKIDPSKNQTVESVNEHWVEITKAFKALTDEEIRNNYLQYGHPDGKQSFSMGIALPKFIVEDGYGKYTLVFYLALLGILLPYLAGRWWYGTQRFTKDGILVNSAGTLVREYKETIDEASLVATLSGGEEYEAVLGSDRVEAEVSKVETSITADGAISNYSGGFAKGDRQRLDELSDLARRKVLALLWAYLGRVDLGDETLNKEKFGVAPVAWQLNDAFQVISQAFSTLKPLVSSLHTSQYLIQAIPPGGSPLLQLPYFTPKIVKAIEGNSPNHFNIQEYMSLPADRRKKLTVGAGLLTDSQYQTAMTTAKQLPFIKVEKLFFKVRGEKVVTANSLVQLIVKFRFVPPGTTSLPPIDPKDLLQPDSEMDDKEDAKRFTPTLAHAPFFSRDHSPVWHIFLGDAKMGRIAVPPFNYSTFDKPVLTAEGEPTFNMQTIKMQFGAPPQEGRYTFIMHLINDSYVGFDIKEHVTLVVEDASKAEVIEDDGEISEPDEDSIAGQMKALKNGVVAVDSDESDTEGDVDEDSSDTNTDTEDES